MASTWAASDTSTGTNTAVPPAAFDGGDGVLTVGPYEIGHGDPRALGREQLGRDPAHALARTGDERDLAVESSHTTSPVSFG